MPASPQKSADLDSLPAGWSRKRVGEVADVNSETLGIGTDQRYRFRYVEISSVSPGRINWDATSIQEARTAPSRARRRLRAGDVLFCTVRPGLQAHAWIKHGLGEDLVASTGFAALRPRAIEGRFLFHWIFSEPAEEQIRRLEVGSNYPAVSESDVSRLVIACPPPLEQHRIAEILDAVDETTVATESLIEKLEAIRTGFLHDLLTCGIDEAGRLRDPISHREQFTAYEEGLFPVSWQRRQLRELLAGYCCGPSPTCEERTLSSDDEWGLLKTTAITWENGWDWTQHKLLPRAYWGRGELEVRSGDIIITKAGPRHRVGVVTFVDATPQHLIVSGKMVALRALPEICAPSVLAAALAMPGPQRFLDRLTTGMAESQVNFSNEALLRTPVVMPPPDEQARIAHQLEALNRCVADERDVWRKQRQLKNGLMHDLLRGKVHVSP